jgi:hypothetical protein
MSPSMPPIPPCSLLQLLQLSPGPPVQAFPASPWQLTLLAFPKKTEAQTWDFPGLPATHSSHFTIMHARFSSFLQRHSPPFSWGDQSVVWSPASASSLGTEPHLYTFASPASVLPHSSVIMEPPAGSSSASPPIHPHPLSSSLCNSLEPSLTHP